jgi:hypothetical protein
MVLAECNLKNSGNINAWNSSIGFYLSSNTTWDASDILLSNSSATGVYAGSYETVDQYLTIPEATTPGNYYILFYADPSNVIAEQQETNNVAYVQVNIVKENKVPVSGHESVTTCNGTVTDNGGSSDYYSNYCSGMLTIYPNSSDDDVRLTFTSFSLERGYDYLSIYNGTSNTAPLLGSYSQSPGTITASNPSGALTLYFYSDLSQVYSGFSADISCVASDRGIDLALGYLQPSSYSIAAGDSTEMYFEINNAGGVDVANSTLAYYLSSDQTLDGSDLLLKRKNISPVSFGNSTTGLFFVTIPAGTAVGNYYIIGRANDSSISEETNQANNVLAIPIEVTPTTGIHQGLSATNMQIYPNPSKGKITLELNASAQDVTFQLTLMNAGGDILEKREVTVTGNKTEELDFSTYAPGIYIMNLMNDTHYGVQKLVISK